jgi:hypothetical protein
MDTSCGEKFLSSSLHEDGSDMFGNKKCISNLQSIRTQKIFLSNMHPDCRSYDPDLSYQACPELVPSPSPELAEGSEESREGK